MDAENRWRKLYGQALQGRPRIRLRVGAKAEYEYQQQLCTHYLIVPFTADVAGLPVHVLGRRLGAYECHGPLAPLDAFCDVELFVCPTDFAWSMVYTHEDYAWGGPYFIRAEWLR
ncbi:MAG TPA: hypothetical protein VMS17_02390 [Gemmataceae bacterium]|nr:hypothetical protein [Gemmataceae bacterium]